MRFCMFLSVLRRGAESLGPLGPEVSRFASGLGFRV